MATIEVRGYVQKPTAKETKGGKKYSQFNLGVKQVDKAFGDRPEKVTWANFRVSDYGNTSPPAEKSYATVTGYLKVNEVELDGGKRTFLEITAKSVEIAEPFNTPGDVGGKAKAPAKDPWD